MPTLIDTARIDCLNNIAAYYLMSMQKDSSDYFIKLVAEESGKINYKHGMACSYMLRAGFVNHFHNDFTSMKELALEALRWHNLTPNKKDIAIAYWQISFALFRLGNSEEALVNAKLCYEWASKSGDDAWVRNILESMTDIYRETGEYDKLLAAQRELIQSDKGYGHTAHELWVMGLMHMFSEDYPTALTYWRKLFSGSKNPFLVGWNLMEYAELLTQSNLPDSALFYYNLFDSAGAETKDLRLFLVSKGEYFHFLKQYHTALPYLKKGLIYHSQFKDFAQTKRTLLDIAKVYSAIQQNDSAIRYAQEGLAMALQAKAKPHIRDGYEILYSVYDRMNKADSAYHYYRNYIDMKEMVMNDQMKGKIAAYKHEQEITSLNKEKQLQQQKLNQTAEQRRFLIIGIAGLLLLGIFLIRNIMLKRKNEANRREIAENELLLQKVENEKTKAELELQATELEMQALRAQMNPHFIFNSLNSINRFILQNNKAQASEYLTKFSKLVRMILQNSQASLITLESELEALELYLDLEALRFEQHFTYKISVPKDIDIEILKVPPLIIQPYAENAIWHGLMHKEDKGHLAIEVSQEKDQLFVKITDDGIGRKQAAGLASKSATRHKSMGLKITADRIAMLHKLNGGESPVLINDLVNNDGSSAGTEVIIKIPVMYD